MTRIGFTGTQRGMTPEQAARVCWALETLEGGVLHGCCIGADDQFDQFAVDLGRFRWQYPAKGVGAKQASCHRSPWTSYRFDPEEPLVRNRRIVDDCDLLLAAPRLMQEERRSGTWATIRYARRVGRRVVIVDPEGGVVATSSGVEIAP